MPTPNRLTSQMRSDLIDWLNLGPHHWAGQLDEDKFLSRIYDLRSLPTTDSRRSQYPTAAEDIWQHRVNNPDDWDDDWVFGDSRFNLRHVDDATFTRFLVETVQPAVRRDVEAARELVEGYNDVLRRAGFEIVEDRRVGESVYYRVEQFGNIPVVQQTTAPPPENAPPLTSEFASPVPSQEVHARGGRSPLWSDQSATASTLGDEVDTGSDARESAKEPLVEAPASVPPNARPPHDNGRRRGGGLLGIAVVSLVLVLLLGAVVIQVRATGLALGLLLLLFAIPALALCTSSALLLTDWKFRTALLTGFGGAAVLAGLLLGLLQIPAEPTKPADSAHGQDEASTRRDPSSTSPSPPTPSEPEASPSVEPTLMSEGATERLAGDRVLLTDAQSIAIEQWGLRVATSNVYSTFANVLISTDEQTCDSVLNVGEVIVLSDRQPGEVDYGQWYAVVLEQIANEQATLFWSVGTGRAPAAEPWNSCV
ncbi:hypothetical protein JNB63_17585 [Microbacterium trichothecenolyticum]|uniref:AbiJ-related protein n=1 Tax=Microbacterium trichothecenolyticum TaxID=69370 RepID=UPI001C6ECE14|nr:hypothetical protein [Microbacterium trichothecenolyticum]MBW9121913.1 hypothetical protein [Microbacterium trichothecenolyticum]